MSTLVVKEYFFALLCFPLILMTFWSLTLERGHSLAFGAVFTMALLFGVLFVLQ